MRELIGPVRSERQLLGPIVGGHERRRLAANNGRLDDSNARAGGAGNTTGRHKCRNATAQRGANAIRLCSSASPSALGVLCPLGPISERGSVSLRLSPRLWFPPPLPHHQRSLRQSEPSPDPVRAWDWSVLSSWHRGGR